jgi:hypothetical protein
MKWNTEDRSSHFLYPACNFMHATWIDAGAIGDGYSPRPSQIRALEIIAQKFRSNLPITPQRLSGAP